MRQWYYNTEGQQRGPVAEPDFIKLFETAHLLSDTLVWTEGLAAWTPARDIEGLVPAAYNPPPAPPPLPSNAPSNFIKDTATSTGPQTRPWIRYWARMIDFMLFCLIAGLILGIVYPPALEIPDALFGVIFLFLYNFVEAAMFAAWGTTPGKALLNIRVRNSNSSKLTFSDALSRVFSVWFRGEGLGIPIVALFTQITAYNKLTKQGFTTWDQVGNFTVSHHNIQAWRGVLAVVLLVGFVFLVAIGQADI